LIVKARRAAGGVAFFAAALLWVAPTMANQPQLQAVLAKYFLQVHHAIPLDNNPSVRSGDVLHMPDEGTFVAREKCFHLSPVQYRDLGIEFIQTSPTVVAEVGGAIPVNKIGQIEASVGGKLVENASLLLDPFNADEPPGGYAVLQHPSNSDYCGIIANIWAGQAPDYVLVTRVLHGSLNAWAELWLSGNAKVSADLEKEVQTILGSTPEVHVKGSGSYRRMQYSRSPQPRSLAIQSAVIRPDELARIYLRYRTPNGEQLALLVQEYLTGSDPGLLQRARVALIELLHELELWRGTVRALYASVFSGEKAVDAQTVRIPQEQWNAFATVAAAHRIAGEQ
jgi:hypothetical protein